MAGGSGLECFGHVERGGDGDWVRHCVAWGLDGEDTRGMVWYSRV